MKDIPSQITVINSRDIRNYNTQTTGDLLERTGNVFLQKSQQEGGSPVLRGFEASRVLIVIDGVRMNNAIYRAGHLQNVLRIDQSILEKITGEDTRINSVQSFLFSVEKISRNTFPRKICTFLSAFIT